MNGMLQEIKNILPENVSERLTDKHGSEVRILLKSYRKFQDSSLTPDELSFEAKIVLEYTWERLNVGRWIDVPVETKQVYSIASFIQVVALLSGEKEDVLKKALEVADKGILLGYPLESFNLTKVADILSKHIGQQSVRSGDARASAPASDETASKKIKLDNEIESIICPSLEHFHNNYFTKRRAVKLTSCVDHWPALKLWRNLEYIKEIAGARTVPVELGKHYADSSYSQKLMTIADFIEQYFRDNAETIGYLAQHQLFDQVPELKKDIHEPEYCALSENLEGSSDVDINAWFGPKGTVSPLHFDPKHNLLVQVVGTKKIILYPEKDSQFLYPHESTLLFNTSRVDVENPNFDLYPGFRNATKTECLLLPGQMLYIPPKFWHHVRALENSFSVSFWWQ